MGELINRVAWEESANLAGERGPFPQYEASALKKNGLPPVRNASVITIAPTGTISRIAGCSSGIEPHFANAWWSNVLWKDQSEDGASERLLDAPTSVWEALQVRLDDDDQVRKVLGEIAARPEDAERILEEHGQDPAIFRTSMMINAESHVRMQAVWQKHVTNSVSKTINLPFKATVEDVNDAYWLAWREQCKAVTVYRDRSKSMQVLETGKEVEADGQPEHLLVPRRRPTTVRGVPDRVRTGHGHMYVNVTFAEDGRAAAVVNTLGESGALNRAPRGASTRLISLALRSGIEPGQIIEHLSGITCCPVWDDGVLVRSTPDAVALVLSRHLLGESDSVAVAETRVEASAAQLGLFPSSKDANGNTRPSGARCPECSGYVVHQEGCIRGLDCGYTKCE